MTLRPYHFCAMRFLAPEGQAPRQHFSHGTFETTEDILTKDGYDTVLRMLGAGMNPPVEFSANPGDDLVLMSLTPL